MSEATQTEKKQAQKERKAYRAKKRKLFFKTLFSRKIVLVSAIVVLLIILIAIFADFLMPYNPNQISIPERNQGMSAAHWLGTDEYGRDLLSRVIAGSRVSLIVGLLAVIIACVIGTTLGMIAGYFGGIVDDIINRTSEAVRVIPQIVFAIALCAVFGGGILNLAIVLGISNTTVYIRMMRSQVLVHQGTRLHHGGQAAGQQQLPPDVSPHPPQQYFSDYRHHDAASWQHDFERSGPELLGAGHFQANGNVGRAGQRRPQFPADESDLLPRAGHCDCPAGYLPEYAGRRRARRA